MILKSIIIYFFRGFIKSDQQKIKYMNVHNYKYGKKYYVGLTRIKHENAFADQRLQQHPSLLYVADML